MIRIGKETELERNRMQTLTVERAERDQRFNKYLQRKLPDAPSSFIYKMLRKKNITLNGKKASGSELLQEGDLVTLFLSDETYEKFGGKEAGASDIDTSEEERAFLDAYRELNGRIGSSGILYEDDHILAVRKPVGILSQKASDTDRSMNEWLVGYLISEGKTDMSRVREFRPSVCSRLDRNTGGILLCAKTLPGARLLTQLLRDRTLHKYYQAAVLGSVTKGGDIEGYLKKDRGTNTVRFVRADQSGQGGISAKRQEKGAWTKTSYKPLAAGSRFSLLEMELITGRTHQIRSHLSSIGHPILGDPKYGNMEVNRRLRERYGLRGQMLWCSRVEFPVLRDAFGGLSCKVIRCDPPLLYRQITEEAGK